MAYDVRKLLTIYDDLSLIIYLGKNTVHVLRRHNEDRIVKTAGIRLLTFDFHAWGVKYELVVFAVHLS